MADRVIYKIRILPENVAQFGVLLVPLVSTDSFVNLALPALTRQNTLTWIVDLVKACHQKLKTLQITPISSKLCLCVITSV